MGIGMVMPRGKADKRAPPAPSASPELPGSSPPVAFRRGPVATRGDQVPGAAAAARRGTAHGGGDTAGPRDRHRSLAPKQLLFFYTFFFKSPLFFRWGSPARYFLASLRCAQDLTLSAVALGSDNFISQRLQNKNFFPKEISRSTHPPTQGLFWFVLFSLSFFLLEYTN